VHGGGEGGDCTLLGSSESLFKFVGEGELSVAELTSKSGVAIPGENSDDDVPWRIKHSVGTQNELDQEVDAGSSDGDESVAERAYEAANAKQAKEHSEIVTGVVASVLEKFRLKPGEAEEIEAARKLKMRKAKKKDLKKDTPNQSKKRSFFAMCGDDSDSDGGAAKKRKAKAKAGGAQGSAGGKIAKSAQGGAGGKILKSAQCVPGGDAEVSEGGDEDKKQGRGAPTKDAVGIAKVIWSSFQKADQHSTFFEKDASKVQKQYVVRWANTLRSAAEHLGPDDADKRANLEDHGRQVVVRHLFLQVGEGVLEARFALGRGRSPSLLLPSTSRFSFCRSDI